MPRAKEPDALTRLADWSHTEVKLKGVRELVEQARVEGGALRLKHHQRSTAVVLTPQAYLDLVQRAESGDAARAKAPDPLKMLRARFDERLEQLQRRGAPERLDAAFGAPTGEMSRMCEMPMLAG